MMQTEAAVQQKTRLLATLKGMLLWRNNVGAYVDERGNRIRYGLCNDSAKLNASLKSSDLIGITPVTITPDMVGTVVGVFTAIECKEEGWCYMHTLRERAQLAFINLVKEHGGIAKFVDDPGQL